MQSIRLSDAQGRLPALVDAVAQGDEVIITRNDGVPMARLTAATPLPGPRPSLREHRPSSLGRMLQPVSHDDDLLAEMLDDWG